MCMVYLLNLFDIISSFLALQLFLSSIGVVEKRTLCTQLFWLFIRIIIWWQHIGCTRRTLYAVTRPPKRRCILSLALLASGQLVVIFPDYPLHCSPWMILSSPVYYCGLAYPLIVWVHHFVLTCWFARQVILMSVSAPYAVRRTSHRRTWSAMSSWR